MRSFRLLHSASEVPPFGAVGGGDAWGGGPSGGGLVGGTSVGGIARFLGVGDSGVADVTSFSVSCTIRADGDELRIRGDGGGTTVFGCVGGATFFGCVGGGGPFRGGGVGAGGLLMVRHTSANNNMAKSHENTSPEEHTHS